jgi:mannose-6-phosphate isomerase-like protein (cupin superfamily)
MRTFEEILGNTQTSSVTKNYYEERPWGSFEHLLDEEYCKVKRIIVKPGERLSYQYHHKRSEAWVIVEGVATVTLNDKEITYKVGEIVDIPVKTKHRVKNASEEDLIFIETQTGTYFGEDDIVRLSDDYDRVEKKEDIKKEIKKEIDKQKPQPAKEVEGTAEGEV